MHTTQSGVIGFLYTLKDQEDMITLWRKHYCACDIDVVATLLGHEEIDVTARYVDLDRNVLPAIFENAVYNGVHEH